MKKKDREALKNLSVEELKAEIRHTREKSFRLKFNRASSPITNPLELRQLRRKAAMLNTYLRAKDIERGAAKERTEVNQK